MAKLQARIRELLDSDFEKGESNPYLRYRKAMAKAASEIKAKSANPLEGHQKSLARDERDARDKAILARANTLLEKDPGLRALNQTDERRAFRTALRKAATETPSPVETDVVAKNRAALDRAKRVHKVAMTMLRYWPDLASRAAKNYPEAFEAAHRAAESNMLLHITQAQMDATSFKHGSLEAGIHAKALKLLTEPWLRSRDTYDAEGAFDEAIREASVSPIDMLDPDRPNEMRLTRAGDRLPLW